MQPFFAISPWEYPGIDFESTPQAVTRLEIGGKKRNFWLKMRDGVLFFREPTLVPLFAIPKLFDQNVAHDPERLVEVWKEEIERQNYGAFLISHRLWPNTPASANYCIILRAEGSGWIKEHFDVQWQQFALQGASSLNLWRSGSAYSDVTDLVVRSTRSLFLARSVDAAHFRTVAPHWSGGGSQEMLSVLRSAAYLLVKPEELSSFDKHPLEWNCKSGSSFWAGSVSGSLAYSSSHHLNLVWNIAKWHYGFVGVEWKKASDSPDLQAQFGTRTWKQGFDRWGENWRGNWIGSQYQDKLFMPSLGTPSHHDKLESALVLREFLRDKMPVGKMNALLDKGMGD